MSLLTPEPGLVFWMLISFGVVVFVLAKYGFPVILQMVEKRKNYIENSLLSAQKAHEELAKIEEKSEALLAKARQEQTEILNETSKIREQMIKKAQDEARQESEKMITAAREQVRLEKEDAIRSIRNEITSLSVDIAEKILREKLGTEEEQMNMIDRLLDEMNIPKSQTT